MTIPRGAPRRAGAARDRDDRARRGSDLRRRNAASILQALRDQGPLPRVDLASSLALSSGAVTRLTADLVEFGLLRELDPVASVDVGRRRVPIDLSAEGFLVAGVHIGRLWTTFGLVDLRGRVIEGPHKIEHADTEPRLVVDEVVDAVAELVAAGPEDARILGTGISSGAAVAKVSGTVADHDALGWHDVDIPGLVGDRLDGLLTVESTYRAMATAEMWFGAAREIRSFVHMFVGRVFGAALVFDGIVHDGVDRRAGGIAHLPVSHAALQPCTCGRAGCLISVTGSSATIARAHAAGLDDVRDVADVVRLSADGDERAAQVLRERTETIGEAVSVLVELLAPEKVVLAGAALVTDDDLAMLRQIVVNTVTHPVDAQRIVVPTALGEPATANVVASATPVLEQFYSDPIAYVVDIRPAVAAGQ